MNLLRPYRMALRYALLCPMPFLLPALFELVQHVAELHAGFYDSLAAMKAAAYDPARMIFGHAKIVILFLTAYWAARFYGFGEDRRAAIRFDPTAVRLFVPVMLWSLAWFIVVQDGPILTDALGLPPRPVGFAMLFLMLANMLLEVALAAWKTSACLGLREIGFMRSLRLTAGQYCRALGLTLAAMLPLMVVHYALTFATIGQALWITGFAMAVDSLLVAYMVPVSVAANWMIACRVAERNGLTLAPQAT